MSIITEPSGSLPQVRTPRSIVWARSSPSGVVQRSPGWITTCGGVPGSSAKRYGSRPAGDDDVAGTEPGAVTVVEHHPRLAVHHRHQRERRFVLRPAPTTAGS